MSDLREKSKARHYALLSGGALFIVISQWTIVWLAPGLTHTTAVSFTAVMPFITLLSIPTLLLLVLTPLLARVSPNRIVLAAVIALGATLRVMWFGSPAPVEDDFFRYLWDGAVTAYGYNPYKYAPQAFTEAVNAGDQPQKLVELAGRAEHILKNINFPDLRSIYPGTAQASFAVAHWVAPFNIDGLRAVFLACEAATLLLLLRLLHASGASLYWAGLYWCNPFVSAMLIGGAHVDAVIPPLVLSALVFVLRGRLVLASVAVGLAAGVKLWPLLLAPLIFRQALTQPLRLGLTLTALAAASGATILPLFFSAFQEGSGLTAYAKSWANNNALFLWASHLLHLFMPLDAAIVTLKTMVAAIAGIAALAMAWTLPVSAADLYRRALIITGVAFFCSPAQFPWYASWFLPIAALFRFWPLLAVPALLPAYYFFFPLWETPYNAYFFYGVALVHALPLLAWIAWRFLRIKLSPRTHAPIQRQI